MNLEEGERHTIYPFDQSWGIREGDIIRIGTQSAKVTKVNHETSTITIEAPSIYVPWYRRLWRWFRVRWRTKRKINYWYERVMKLLK